MGSADLDGMIFTQLEGRMSSKTSSSVNMVSSSLTAEALTHFPPTDGAHQGQAVRPALPNIEGPSCKPRSSGVVSA